VVFDPTSLSGRLYVQPSYRVEVLLLGVVLPLLLLSAALFISLGCPHTGQGQEPSPMDATDRRARSSPGQEGSDEQT